jgi:hypothetical protein
MSTKPDRRGQKAPPVINRLKWIAGITRRWDKYSALQLAVAGALGWDFTDKVTAETFVKAKTVAKHVGATLRPVSEAYALFIKDGWLEKITSAAPGRPARYRLTFPQTQEPSGADRAQSRKTPEQYIEAFRKWLNLLKNETALMAAWEHPDNKKRYERWCNSGGPEKDKRRALLLELRDERLAQLRADQDEEIPF